MLRVLSEENNANQVNQTNLFSQIMSDVIAYTSAINKNFREKTMETQILDWFAYFFLYY